MKNKATAGLRTRLEDIERLFRELEADKTLPTFGEHFMMCLLAGTARKVNLEQMYPGLYVRLSGWIKEYGRSGATPSVK